MRRRLCIGAVLLFAAFLTASVRSEEGHPQSFVFHDGDRIVLVGDSITVEGHYGRYIETFLRTRFPQWRLAFRNAGINGQTATGGFNVIDADVLIWKPTIVIVNYGMNDGRRAGGVEFYRAGITRYVERLLSAGTRVVLCSNSPIDVGDLPDHYTDYNVHFDEMARFAQRFAKEKKIPFVDQFHFCHRIWGENRNREKPVPVSDQTLAQHTSDYVHARAPGQLTMAYVILKTLGAPAEVSHATIDTASAKIMTRHCRVTDLAIADDGGGLSFTRTDDASPCWIDDRGALGMELVPFQQESNRMTLAVNGLAKGDYELRIDDLKHGQYTSDELKVGVNLAANRQSPIYAPGRKVEAAISEQYRRTRILRDLNFFQPPTWLTISDLDEQKKRETERRMPEIDAGDATIAAAAQPVPHLYRLVRISAAGAKP